jgi:transcriptional regulator with XRE-family HTH domain
MKEWREAHGLTQKRLAEEAGVGEVTVARIEMGMSVSPSTARKIADTLGIHVADLLAHPPEPAAMVGKGRAPLAAGQPEDEEEQFRRELNDWARQLFEAARRVSEKAGGELTAEERHRFQEHRATFEEGLKRIDEALYESPAGR